MILISLKFSGGCILLLSGNLLSNYLWIIVNRLLLLVYHLGDLCKWSSGNKRLLEWFLRGFKGLLVNFQWFIIQWQLNCIFQTFIQFLDEFLN